MSGKRKRAGKQHHSRGVFVVVVVSYRVSVGGAAAVAVVGNSQGRELP